MQERRPPLIMWLRPLGIQPARILVWNTDPQCQRPTSNTQLSTRCRQCGPGHRRPGRSRTQARDPDEVPV